MNVYQSQVFHFNLGAYGSSWSDATIQVKVYNSQNQVVFQMAAAAGQVDSGTAFLRRGSYRVEVSVVYTSNFGYQPSMGYGLQMYGLTDPEGASPTDPTGGASGGDGDTLPPPPDPGTTVVIVPPPAPPPSTIWF
jgi:hypothetical protein